VAAKVEFVSQSDFARRMGVNLSTVKKALASGRIQKRKDGKIDWSVQSKLWKENADHSKYRGDEEDQNGGGRSALANVRLARETYNAQLKKIEIDRLSSKLIERDPTREAIFNYTRGIRDGVLRIPGRVASRLTAELEELIAKAIKKKLGKSAGSILSQLDSDTIYRLVLAVWDSESKSILESLANGKVIEDATKKQN